MAEDGGEKPQAQEEQADPAPLGSAGASSNPLVHQLLAERAIAVSAAADGEGAAAVEAIDGKLAELGVSVDA